jgi:hypothetical protein
MLSFIQAVNCLPFQIHAADIGVITASAMRVMDEHLVVQVDELRRQYLYLCTSKASLCTSTASKLRTWAKPASKGASGATANVCFFLVFCEVNLTTEVHGPVTLGPVCSSISLAQYCSPDPSPPTLHTFTRRSLRDTGAEAELLRCQYLYFCTRKASNLSTPQDRLRQPWPCDSSTSSICTFVPDKQGN